MADSWEPSFKVKLPFRGMPNPDHLNPRIASRSADGRYVYIHSINLVATTNYRGWARYDLEGFNPPQYPVDSNWSLTRIPPVDFDYIENYQNTLYNNAWAGCIDPDNEIAYTFVRQAASPGAMRLVQGMHGASPVTLWSAATFSTTPQFPDAFGGMNVVYHPDEQGIFTTTGDNGNRGGTGLWFWDISVIPAIPTRVVATPGFISGSRSNHVWAPVMDNQGRIWFCSHLSTFNPSPTKNEWTLYCYDPGTATTYSRYLGEQRVDQTYLTSHPDLSGVITHFSNDEQDPRNASVPSSSAPGSLYNFKEIYNYDIVDGEIAVIGRCANAGWRRDPTISPLLVYSNTVEPYLEEDQYPPEANYLKSFIVSPSYNVAKTDPNYPSMALGTRSGNYVVYDTSIDTWRAEAPILDLEILPLQALGWRIGSHAMKSTL